MKLAFALLLALTLVVFSACTQSAGTTTQEDEELPVLSTIIEEDEEAPPPDTIVLEDEDAARQVVFEYWEAFNNYDAEGALACLEESYRQEREQSIKSDIGQMQSFGVTLGVEEEAEPAFTPEGKVEIKIKLDVPMFQPDRHVTYRLEKINDEWKICLTVEE